MATMAAIPISPGRARILQMPTRQIRVLTLDDHQLVQEGLAAMINGEPDMTVVATASGAAEALEAVRRYRPDVVTLDLLLAGIPGERPDAAHPGRVSSHAHRRDHLRTGPAPRPPGVGRRRTWADVEGGAPARSDFRDSQGSGRRPGDPRPGSGFSNRRRRRAFAHRARDPGPGAGGPGQLQ